MYKPIRKADLIKGGTSVKQGEIFTLGFQLFDAEGLVIVPSVGQSVTVKIANKLGVVYDDVAIVVDDHIEFTVDINIGFGKFDVELKVSDGADVLQKYPANGFIELHLSHSLDDVDAYGLAPVTADVMIARIVTAENNANAAADATLVVKDATVVVKEATESVRLDTLQVKTDTLTAKSATETATTNADTKAAYATAQGDYALQVGDDNKTRFLQAVDTIALRDSTYATPAHGDTVRVTGISTSFRFVTGSGWVKTDEYNPTAIDEVTSNLADVVINVKSFGAKGDGVTDDAQSIKDAIAYAFSLGGGKVKVPLGVYRFTSTILIPKGVVLEGSGFGTNVGDGAPTVLLKDGVFDGVIVGDVNSGLENISVEGANGNGGVGVFLKGARSFIRKVSSVNHGGHGFYIGDTVQTGATNIWRAQDILALGNGGHGVYINSEGNPLNSGLPDANAGYLLGLDSRDNSLDGLCLENAIDNGFYSVVCQYNGGYGIHLLDGADGNHFYTPYTEINATGEIKLEVGADRNMVDGYRSGVNSDVIVDEGLGNYIVGRDSQSGYFNPYFKSITGFKHLLISDTSISGQWEFKQNVTNRNLEIFLKGTSSTPVTAEFKHVNGGLVILNPNQLKLGTGSIIKGLLTKSVALNSGAIGATTSRDTNTIVAGCKVGDVVQATPQTPLSLGITWSAYISAIDTVTVRVTNITGATINVDTVGWGIVVTQI